MNNFDKDPYFVAEKILANEAAVAKKTGDWNRYRALRTSLKNELSKIYANDPGFAELPAEIQNKERLSGQVMGNELRRSDVIKEELRKQKQMADFTKSGLYDHNPNDLFYWQHLPYEQLKSKALELGFDIDNPQDAKDFRNYLVEDTNMLKRAEITKDWQDNGPGSTAMSILAPTAYEEAVKQLSTGQGKDRDITKAYLLDSGANTAIAAIPGISKGVLNGKLVWKGIPGLNKAPVVGDVAQQVLAEAGRQGAKAATGLGNGEFDPGDLWATAVAAGTIPTAFRMIGPAAGQMGKTGKKFASGVESSIMGDPMEEARNAIKSKLPKLREELAASNEANKSTTKVGKNTFTNSNDFTQFVPESDFTPGVVIEKDLGADPRVVRQTQRNSFYEKELARLDKEIEEGRKKLKELGGVRKEGEHQMTEAKKTGDKVALSEGFGKTLEGIAEERIKPSVKYNYETQRRYNNKMQEPLELIKVEPEPPMKNFETVDDFKTEDVGRGIESASKYSGTGTKVERKNALGRQPQEIQDDINTWSDYAKHLTLIGGSDPRIKQVGENAMNALGKEAKDMTDADFEALNNLVDVASKYPETLTVWRSTLDGKGFNGATKVLREENAVANNVEKIAQMPEIRSGWDNKGAKKAGLAVGRFAQDVGGRLEPALGGKSPVELVKPSTYDIPPYQDSAWYKKLNSRQRALVDNLFKAKED